MKPALDPCRIACQYGVDIGMPGYSCADGIYRCDHYVDPADSEEMILVACWLHGQTLWRLDFETLWWRCPLEGCDAKMREETAYRRKIVKILVPPLFGFGRLLP